MNSRRIKLYLEEPEFWNIRKSLGYIGYLLKEGDLQKTKIKLNKVKDKIDDAEILYRFMQNFMDLYIKSNLEKRRTIEEAFNISFERFLSDANLNRGSPQASLWWTRFYRTSFIPLKIDSPLKIPPRILNPTFLAINELIRLKESNWYFRLSPQERDNLIINIAEKYQLSLEEFQNLKKAAGESSSPLRKKDISNLQYQRLKEILGDKYLIAPFVIEMPLDDFKIIKSGISQRAKAIVEFLKDIYSGKWQVVKDGIIPESALLKALETQGFEELVGDLSSETIMITYGPDIFYPSRFVIEDNIGNLGGREDVFYLQDAFLRVFENLNLIKTEELFIRYLKELEKILPKKKGIIAVWLPRCFNEDFDRIWMINLYKRFGYFVVDEGKDGQNKFEVNKDGLYAVYPDGRREKIGYLIYYDYDLSLDPYYPPFKKRMEVFGYEKITEGIPGIIDLVQRERIFLSHHPGSSLADSKLIYPFVERFINYYLKERPILKQTDSFALTKDYGIDYLSYKQAIEKKDSLVIKPIRGEEGEGVVIGRKVSNFRWREVLDKAYENPKDFIFSRYIRPSILDNYCIVYRLICDVMPDGETTFLPTVYCRTKILESDTVIGQPDTYNIFVIIEGINRYSSSPLSSSDTIYNTLKEVLDHYKVNSMDYLKAKSIFEALIKNGVVQDNPKELSALMQIVAIHTKHNRVGDLKRGYFKLLAIVEEKGSQFTIRLEEKEYVINDVRVMLAGREELYLEKDFCLSRKDKDYNEIYPHIQKLLQEIFRKGKRYFEASLKQPGKYFAHYFLEFPEEGYVIDITLDFKGAVWKVSFQKPNTFSYFALSCFGNVPIQRAREIIRTVNNIIRWFEEKFKQRPKIFFERTKADLIITNPDHSFFKFIPIKKEGKVEVFSPRIGFNFNLLDHTEIVEDVSDLFFISGIEENNKYSRSSSPLSNWQIINRLGIREIDLEKTKIFGQDIKRWCKEHYLFLDTPPIYDSKEEETFREYFKTWRKYWSTKRIIEFILDYARSLNQLERVEEWIENLKKAARRDKKATKDYLTSKNGPFVWALKGHFFKQIDQLRRGRLFGKIDITDMKLKDLPIWPIDEEGNIKEDLIGWMKIKNKAPPFEYYQAKKTSLKELFGDTPVQLSFDSSSPILEENQFIYEIMLNIDKDLISSHPKTKDRRIRVI
ncbi:MAG: circularly permuted type 2 ATP-grasp protein, partial [Candidatus Omnitrophica bacterium]|nr:circularly permuted type 2 ATP-grasp protein [Candidatus Omnitrophota bacterium]